MANVWMIFFEGCKKVLIFSVVSAQRHVSPHRNIEMSLKDIERYLMIFDVLPFLLYRPITPEAVELSISRTRLARLRDIDTVDKYRYGFTIFCGHVTRFFHVEKSIPPGRPLIFMGRLESPTKLGTCSREGGWLRFSNRRP